MSQVVEGPMHQGEQSLGRPVQSISQFAPSQQVISQVAGAPAQSNRQSHPLVEQSAVQPPEQSTAQHPPAQVLQSVSQLTQVPFEQF